MYHLYNQPQPPVKCPGHRRQYKHACSCQAVEIFIQIQVRCFRSENNKLQQSSTETIILFHSIKKPQSQDLPFFHHSLHRHGRQLLNLRWWFKGVRVRHAFPSFAFMCRSSPRLIFSDFTAVLSHAEALGSCDKTWPTTIGCVTLSLCHNAWLQNHLSSSSTLLCSRVV